MRFAAVSVPASPVELRLWRVEHQTFGKVVDETSWHTQPVGFGGME